MRPINMFCILSIIVGTTLAQLSFTLHTPEELGIDTVFGYQRNSFVDYNQDGYLDFFSCVVYLNEGSGHFTRLDSTRIFNAELVDWGDFDGDGWQDLVTNRMYGGQTIDTNYIFIYRNEGPPNWTLRNVSDSLGLGFQYPIYDRDLVDPAWIDYDQDGWLDFYLTSYEYPYNSAQGHADYLFHNHQGQFFTDVSESCGVTTLELCSRGASLFDFDEDGDIDIFVSVYRLEPNILWQNNGDGSFTDVAAEKGVQGLYINGYYGHNIGAAIADYNNDGHMDIFTPITHHAGYPGDSTGHLWINNGPPNWDFTCHFAGSGMINTEIGSSPSCADYDNDGDVDLLYINLYGAPSPNFWLYRNEGNCVFTDVSDSLGFQHRQRLNYALWGDINHDGFMDIFWSRYDGSAYHYEFYINSGGNGNHWLELDLVGDVPNTSAIGARVDAFAGDLRVSREVLHNQGEHYGSLFVTRQHFGLGTFDTVDSLVIQWPSGLREVYFALPTDTIMRIEEGASGIKEPNLVFTEQSCHLIRKGKDLIFYPKAGKAKVIDASGRVCARLITDSDGKVCWRTEESGVYFILMPNQRRKSVVKIIVY